jgi:hypothetical protein
MKKLSLILLVIFSCAGVSFAQDKYQFGTREVRVPGPEGFANVMTRFPAVTARAVATEDPRNEVLAVFVPETFVPKLQESEEIDLGLYTKVSVSRAGRGAEITPDFYRTVVADIEKNLANYLDPDGEVVKNVEKNSTKGLSDLGNKTTVDMTSSKIFGTFDKTDRVFSSMILVGTEINGRKVSTLGTMSVVFVNHRLVYVYAYKMSPTENDVKEMNALTKKWTARIVAANK